MAATALLAHGPGAGPGVGAVVLGGLVGWLAAQGPAFALRLHAQTALCQAQIERNTRSTAVHAATMAAAAILPVGEAGRVHGESVRARAGSTG